MTSTLENTTHTSMGSIPMHAVGSQKCWKTENINELASALAKCQGAMKAAFTNKKNDFLRSKYADLESCWDACRKELTDNGLSIMQLPSFDGKMVSVETILSHSSGQWIKSCISAQPGHTNKSGEFVLKMDVQAIGIAITYLRRYGLNSIVGNVFSDEDSDGEPTRSEGERAKSTEAKESGELPEGSKTAHLTMLFKKHGIDMKKAMNYFSESDITCLEEVPDSLVARIEKGPAKFKEATERDA